MERRVLHQAVVCPVPKTVWKALWKMQLPHRVKLFIWKCLKNAVPTRQKLSQFNYLDQYHCNICNFEEESLFHLLLSCNHSKSDKTLNPENTVDRIKYHMSQLSSTPVTINNLANNLITCTGVQSLSPGDDDVLKNFVDISFDYITNECGTGMVLCNSAGAVSGVKGSYATRVRDPETGECMAIMEALSWVRDKNILKIQIVADAESVVKSITMEELIVSWENKKTIRTIKSILSSFNLWSITHVKRDGDRLEDTISKRIRSDKQSMEECYSSALCIDTFLERFIDHPPT
ncbi:uncharacterized protein LOC113352393 [Papaver somniferum]|uniref:uncharacterized protein LOC113352393 n=1 Tax=Papaver somniferum TaxID=3469 RepID=UPI000E700F20|nr:uncharacterized protein LOC113352393 [Papaver somniferum]